MQIPQRQVGAAADARMASASGSQPSASNSQPTCAETIQTLQSQVQQISAGLSRGYQESAANLTALETSTNTLCEQLHQDIGNNPRMLGLTMLVQQHCAALRRQASYVAVHSDQIVEKFDSLSGICGQLEQRLQVVEGERDTAQSNEKALQDRVAFLSLLRNHIPVFQKRMCSELSFEFQGGWEELALVLAQERTAARQSRSATLGPVTQDLDTTLCRLSFTWVDWVNIEMVSDASNTEFQTGYLMAPGDAIFAIESGSLPVPSAFQTSLASIIKMLQYVEAAIKPRKKCSTS